MIGNIEQDEGRDQAADPADYTKAILNVLSDFSDETVRLQGTQKAILNILEDAEADKLRLQDTQKAALNILEDFNQEKTSLNEVQKAILNILEDFDAERKRVEQINDEVTRAYKELEAFSYSVSHDLRTPLRSIDGFSLALLEDYAERLDEQGRDYLERVRGAAQHMGHVIDDLLNLARVTRSELQSEHCDLSAMARSIIKDLRWEMSDREVNVIVQDGLLVNGDPQLLRVALSNLLSNAWKFTGKQPTATIEFGAAPQPDGTIAYFVRDDGVGFDMTYVGKLFGAFQRLHDPSEYSGTGIGLATVQRVIQRHGGRVWADGAVNRGATFYFTL